MKGPMTLTTVDPLQAARDKIAALPTCDETLPGTDAHLHRIAVLAILDHALSDAPRPKRLNVTRLAAAIADHGDICSRMAIPECAADIARAYAAPAKEIIP